MASISTTERATYRRCRRQRDLGSLSRQSLRPIVGAPALDLGTLVHRSLASWIAQEQGRAALASDTRLPPTPPNTSTLQEIFTDHARILVNDITTRYTQQVGAQPSLSEMTPLYEAIELGQHMMHNYEEYWQSPIPQDFHVLAPEQTVHVPIHNTEHTCEDCNGLGHVFTGLSDKDQCSTCDGSGIACHQLEATFDGLLQRKEDGAIYILEHKTWGVHPSQEELDINDQFIAYLWILQQMDIGPVGGIAYDGMWKRKTPPKGKTLPDLFLRMLLRRNAAELREFTLQLTHEAIEMCSPTTYHYKNATRDCKWDCTFYRLCRAMSRGEDVDYIRRTYYTSRTAERTPAFVPSLTLAALEIVANGD